MLACIFAIGATWYSFVHGYIIAYGDAESHLNIAKRVIHSVTPGFAQLGGIWLPVPHLLMVPFVYSDFLWRTGLAGSIVSGVSYVISCLFLYKLSFLVLKDKKVSFLCFILFALNPNVLYMQSTPMTELPLIMFFILSTYFFLKFLKEDSDILALMLSSMYAFFATLCRYDGWFLVITEVGILLIHFVIKKHERRMIEGMTILFSTVAFFGIFVWLLWDLLILGDPFYFTNSPFSAKSQQMGFLLRGQLPAYKNIFMSFLYYFFTSAQNAGIIITILSLVGFSFYVFKKNKSTSLFVPVLFLVPFVFYIVTLYLGQSVIFIPPLTPSSFPWKLFNVRYGMMMIPCAAFFCAYLLTRLDSWKKLAVLALILIQMLIYPSGHSKPITLEDGTSGLSTLKNTDAQRWFTTHYDNGLVLLDDYARSLSIIRSNIPMQQTIYIGNKPYWDESLKQPDKYATWIIMRKGDSIWQHLYDNQFVRASLYKHFRKVYTSPDFLIFKRNTELSNDSSTLLLL